MTFEDFCENVNSLGGAKRIFRLNKKFYSDNKIRVATIVRDVKILDFDAGNFIITGMTANGVKTYEQINLSMTKEEHFLDLKKRLCKIIDSDISLEKMKIAACNRVINEKYEHFDIITKADLLKG